jgi:hypothetical protein
MRKRHRCNMPPALRANHLVDIGSEQPGRQHAVSRHQEGACEIVSLPPHREPNRDAQSSVTPAETTTRSAPPSPQNWSSPCAHTSRPHPTTQRLVHKSAAAMHRNPSSQPRIATVSPFQSRGRHQPPPQQDPASPGRHPTRTSRTRAGHIGDQAPVSTYSLRWNRTSAHRVLQNGRLESSSSH